MRKVGNIFRSRNKGKVRNITSRNIREVIGGGEVEIYKRGKIYEKLDNF